MVTSEEYLAALEQAVYVRGDELEACRVAARRIVKTAASNGWRPRFGGSFREHFKGKVAEAGFQLHAEDLGDVCPESTPFRLRYDRRSLTCDFSFMGPGGLMRVEVKSGCRSLDWMKNADINGFGLQVPTSQARDNLELSDYLVYTVVDLSMLNDPMDPHARVAAIGWCRWDNVLSRNIVKQPVVDYPCYRVPISELRSIDSLYNILKTDCRMNVKTENANAGVILNVE